MLSDLSSRRPRTTVWTASGSVEIPAPAPDVVPLPPSPHPVPPAPHVPPEIIEPPLPVDSPPVREPEAPGEPMRTAPAPAAFHWPRNDERT
jgi:hypothetical protein